MTGLKENEDIKKYGPKSKAVKVIWVKLIINSDLPTYQQI
jgi:hypothetical protein